MLERIFRLSESGTTVRTEVLAGLTTFLTMSYIIFLQPAVLSGGLTDNPTGLDFGAVLVATCVVSAAASVFMGLYARYPIALAPGMGENFFFVSVVGALTGLGFQNAWQTALGIVFVSGVIFLVLSLAGIRQALIDAVSPSMKAAISVGIGLFIAFIGLQNAHVIVNHPASLVALNHDLSGPDVAVFGFGLFVSAVLYARRVPGALLLGIVASALLAGALGQVHFSGNPIALPAVEEPALFRLDILSAFRLACLPLVLVFLIMVVFDTTGTLIGVAERGGFIKDGQVPRANRVLVVDASATVAGAAFGTSTVTAYIESIAGITFGGRTGLVSVTVAVLFLLALLFSPVIQAIAGYSPITAPALVLVGALMMGAVRKVEWDDYTECIPAFLIMLGIPLSFMISDGLALGFVAYPILRLSAGRGKQVHWMMYVVAAVLLYYLVWLRPRMP